jgi:NADP-dependent 3-hydroxy acid dehydrogenase YdfG
VDVLVNNVGDFRPLVRFQASGPESWKSMHEINHLHFCSVTRAFINQMMEARLRRPWPTSRAEHL